MAAPAQVPLTLLAQRAAEAARCTAANLVLVLDVHINVGGTSFITKPTAITRCDNLIKYDLMIQANRTATLIAVDVGLFYDRDPVLFAYILNYLRAPKAWIRPKERHIPALIAEAEYFGVTAIVKLLDVPLREFQDAHPIIVIMFEEDGPDVRIGAHHDVCRMLIARDKGAKIFSEKEQSQLHRKYAITLLYGESYAMLSLIFRQITHLGYRMTATANPNTSHTQYIFHLS